MCKDPSVMNLTVNGDNPLLLDIYWLSHLHRYVQGTHVHHMDNILS